MGKAHSGSNQGGDTNRRIAQAGAVPFRINRSGRVEVLLITSKAGNWIVPKGMVEPGQTTTQTALIEAMEEAGVTGDLVGGVLGHYETSKSGRAHRVRLFALAVRSVAADWPDRGRRQRQWVGVAEAARRIRRHDLRAIVSAVESIAAAGQRMARAGAA